MAELDPAALPDILRDPYPFFAELRRAEPVAYFAAFQSWLLTRHRDVEAVLRRGGQSDDPLRLAHYAELAGSSPERRRTVGALEHLLMHTDEPDHGRLRQLVNRFFTRSRIETMRGRIQALVDELLDRAAGRRGTDFVTDFAVPLPVTVIAGLLGLPPEAQDALKRWSEDMTVLINVVASREDGERALAGVVEMHEYFDGIFAARRREPRDDLISALVAVEEAGEQLDANELFAMCTSILLAGNETTTNLLGNAVIALERHPRERQRLLERPSLVGPAVEEFVRYDGPILMVPARTSREDVQLGGVTIPAGDRIVPVIGAANRDPEAFPEPDRLDCTRDNTHHVGFGVGMRFCLGAWLARLEAECTIGSLLRRFPRFRADVADLEYNPTIFLRSVKRLPLELHG